MSNLTLATPSDNELAISRSFDAPRAKVFAAISTPDTIKRWLNGPPGWTMTDCVIEPKAGTAYRFAWRNGEGGPSMGLGGTITEAVVPERLVATEKFDEPWYPGEALVAQSLAESGGKTTLTITIRYPNKDVRDGVMNSGMTTGMAMNYDRLAVLLAG
jgi:uncharacterized protein YndB with AHSA1/START domain